MTSFYELSEIQGGEINTRREIRDQVWRGGRIFMYMAFSILVVGVVGGVAGQSVLSASYYSIFADFESVQGLKAGDEIEISGVRIGRIGKIDLAEKGRGRVKMTIRKEISLPEDSLVTVHREGVLGKKTISILPGAAPVAVPPQGTLSNTESELSLSDLMGQTLSGKI